MKPELPAGPPVDSVEAFTNLQDWLPRMLAELLASEIYDGENRPPTDARGIYLFSEPDRHLYVGRTGITARARAGTTTSGTSFRSRYNAHTRRGTSPGTAPFANRLMREHADELGLVVRTGWWQTRHDETGDIFRLFCEAKARISLMQFRVVAFDDDERGVRSTVAETYVHSVLRTPYNHFSTS